MRWLLILTSVLLLQYHVCKEASVYQVSGAQVFDLIRGYKPEGGLKLTEVDRARATLSDGIYFEPEDEALSDPEESKYLYLKGFKKDSTKGEMIQN